MASTQVVKVWAEKDRAGALTYALAQPEEDRRRAILVGAILGDWANEDPQTVLRWADSQDGEVQWTARYAAVKRWADQDPAAAAVWAAQLPPGDSRRVWETVSGQWSALDSVAADRWLATLPPGPARAQAAHQYSLNNSDPAATERWIDTLPNGFGRDVVLEQFAWTRFSSGGYTAVGQWLGRIDDQNTRNDKLLRLANVWMAQDPAQAQQWINQGNLPAALLGKVEYRHP